MYNVESPSAFARAGEQNDADLGEARSRGAEDASTERLCWYIFSDGSGGVTVSRFRDVEAATAGELEATLALGEFLEFDLRVVLDLKTATPVMLKAMEHINA